MFRIAVLLLVIALLAGLFGFGFIATVFVDGAKVLFFVFLALALLSFLAGTLYNRRSRE